MAREHQGNVDKGQAAPSVEQAFAGDCVYDSRRRGSSRSKQPRGRQDYSVRRHQSSYTVDADEYRRFQDFVRQQRVPYHRK